MPSALRHTRSQCGSALFMILLAVVLFAALSYAVTSSIQGGSKDGSSENIRTQAALIVGNATLAENLVKRLMLSEGVKEDQFCYLWGSSNCVTSRIPGTWIFAPKGPVANISFFPPYIIENYSSVGPGLIDARIKGVGDDSRSEMLYAIVGISRSICEEINRNLGMSNTFPADNFTYIRYLAHAIDGAVFAEAPASDAWVPANQAMIGDEVSELVGRTEFCVANWKWGGEPTYVKVLIAR